MTPDAAAKFFDDLDDDQSGELTRYATDTTKRVGMCTHAMDLARSLSIS
jgi:hypothetical protein